MAIAIPFTAGRCGVDENRSVPRLPSGLLDEPKKRVIGEFWGASPIVPSAGNLPRGFIAEHAEGRRVAALNPSSCEGSKEQTAKDARDAKGAKVWKGDPTDVIPRSAATRDLMCEPQGWLRVTHERSLPSSLALLRACAVARDDR